MTHDRPSDLPGRIVAAVDRLARAQRAHRQQVAGEMGLNPLQLDILLTLAAGAPPDPIVGQLARELDVRQPTVTDSLAALERKGLVTRRPQARDRRHTRVDLTGAGEVAVGSAATATAALTAAVAALDLEAQEDVLTALLTLIHRFLDARVIDVVRTCRTCAFFRPDNGGHCRLLAIDLPPADIRVNCPEHVPV